MSKWLELIIEEKDFSDGYYYHDAIKRYIQMEKDVPYQLVSAFLQLIKNKEIFKRDKLNLKTTQISTQVLGRISTYSKAISIKKFKSKDDNSKDSTPIIDNNVNDLFSKDFEYILWIVVKAFLKFEEDHEQLDKDDVFFFFYNILSDYEPTDENHKKIITAYKRAVICGILAQEVGYKLSNKKTLSNQEIFDSVRNAIKKHVANIDDDHYPKLHKAKTTENP